MQYYKAKLRLSGNTMNEVREVWSAPEILILQYLHGVEALSEVVPVRNEKVNLRDFKNNLKAKYDPALVKREQSIDNIFGPLGTVPEKLPDDLMDHYDIVDEDDVISVAKSVTRHEKKNDTRMYVPETTDQALNLDRIVPENELSMDEIMG